MSNEIVQVYYVNRYVFIYIYIFSTSNTFIFSGPLVSISGRRIAYLPTGELGKSLTQLKELLTLTVQLLYSGKLHAIQAHEPCNGPLKAKTFILRRKGLNSEHSRASQVSTPRPGQPSKVVTGVVGG